MICGYLSSVVFGLFRFSPGFTVLKKNTVFVHVRTIFVFVGCLAGTFNLTLEVVKFA